MTKQQESQALWLARIQSCIDDFSQVLDVCKAALELHPECAELWNAYGHALERLPNFADAEFAFRRAAELEPGDARGWNNLGVILRKTERLEEAEKAFHKAISVDPSYPNSRFNLVDIKLQRKRDSGAALASNRNREREKLVKNSSDLNVWLSVAEDYIHDGEFQRALKVLEKSFKHHADNSVVSLKLASALQQLGRHSDVESVLRKTVGFEPTNVEAWNWLGVKALTEGNQEESVNCLSRTVAIDRANPHCRLLALILDELGRTGEAIDVLLRSAVLVSTNMNLLGVLQHKIGRHEDAINSFRQGCEGGAEESFIYNNWGRLLEDLGREDEAADAFDRAVELDKCNAVAWNNFGVLLRRRGYIASAEKAFRLSISIAPHFSNPWFNLRDLSLSDGSVSSRVVSDRRLTKPETSKWTQAGLNVYDETHLSLQLVSLQSQKQSSADDPAEIHQLALCMFNARRYNESRDLLQRAVLLDTESAPLWNLLGMSCEKLGERKDAISHYKMSLRFDENYLSAIFNLQDAEEKMSVKRTQP